MKYEVLVNISNHPSERWPREQRLAALQLAERIVDVPFPRVDASADMQAVFDLADQLLEKVVQYRKPIVMLQGEFSLCYALFFALKARSIPVAIPTTERIVREVENPDGSITKTSVFKFVRFRVF